MDSISAWFESPYHWYGDIIGFVFLGFVSRLVMNYGSLLFQRRRCILNNAQHIFYVHAYNFIILKAFKMCVFILSKIELQTQKKPQVRNSKIGNRTFKEYMEMFFGKNKWCDAQHTYITVYRFFKIVLSWKDAIMILCLILCLFPTFIFCRTTIRGFHFVYIKY